MIIKWESRKRNLKWRCCTYDEETDYEEEQEKKKNNK
jgi:hypothetical protein